MKAKFKLYPCYMIEDEATPPDQGLSWQCCSALEYIVNLITRKKRVRVDLYEQYIPPRKYEVK